ncbi:SDR family oxidoreductase [Nitrospina watsonii]|uniref:NAD-dependent epimerase/dehydratase n=1 Tax=Nitrospina watsonii TaxID=1323948 RepID=A0ABM9HC22_9BACT|nr:SDR family oxidoreductase [Nitrospina watsonii]CAI2717617.1 Putative NAD-dependent epimerase/dehydratase [Nitrospina watsonii]
MTSSTQKKLFCFGLGYVGSALAAALHGEGWAVGGTCRTPEKQRTLSAAGWSVAVFDAPAVVPDLAAALEEATHVLVSIPPKPEIGDVVRHHFHDALESARQVEWIGYLSTTGVYGDHDGNWVDETTPLMPKFPHQQRRAEAERAWMRLAYSASSPVHLFRLAGIYGPGRNPFVKIQNGTAQRIDKPGLMFGRVHVDDVVQVLQASIARPHAGRVYNVVDNIPASPREVIQHACDLLQVKPPRLVAFEDAELSEMGKSFYLTNKRVDNHRIKSELGVKLRYPGYRAGLDALFADFK